MGLKATTQDTFSLTEPVVPALAGPRELPALHEVGQEVRGTFLGEEALPQEPSGGPRWGGPGSGLASQGSSEMACAGVPVCRVPGDQPCYRGEGLHPEQGAREHPGTAAPQENASAAPEAQLEVRAECCVSPQGGSCRSLLAGFASRRRRRPL